MQSIIVSSPNKLTQKEYVTTLCEENKIHKFDIQTISFVNTEEGKKTSLGIADVRIVQQALLLSPGYGDKKAVIIEDSELLTTEAQNALLKILEEPPPSVLIFLCVTNTDSLLPTILSRCTIIELSKKTSIAKEDIESATQVIKNLPDFSIGDKLKLAQDITKAKPGALLWLETALHALQELLIKEKAAGNQKEFANMAKSLQKAHATISTTNANPRLLVENELLNL